MSLAPAARAADVQSPPEWKPWPSPAPLVQQEGSKLTQQVLDEHEEWIRARIPVIAGIDPNGTDEKTRACLRFIDDYARLAGEIPYLRGAVLVGSGGNLRHAGVSNPVLLALSAWEYEEKAFGDQDELGMRRAMVELEKGQWPAWVRVAIARSQIAVGSANEQADLVEAGTAALNRWVVAMVCEEPIPDTDLRGVVQFYRHIDREDPDWPVWAGLAERLEKCEPCANPYLRDLMVGIIRTDLAWESRTGKSVRNVTPEQWKGFAENLAIAREYLMRAHAAHPEWPMAAAEMITVAMGEGGDGPYNERFWFHQAIGAQFDHFDSYTRYALSLAPRWGGSLDTMRDFAMACYETGRFDTEVPFMAPLVLRSMATDTGSNFAFLSEDPEFTDALASIFERELERRKIFTVRARTGVDLTAVLWWGRRYEALYSHLAKHSYKIPKDEERRRFWHLDHADVAHDATLYGMNPEIRARILESDVAAGEGDWAAAIEKTESVSDPEFLKPLKLKDVGKQRLDPALADRLAQLRTIEGLVAGEWAPVVRDAAGTGWRVGWGELVAPDKGIPGMMLLRTNDEVSFAHFPVPLTERVRIRGKMDVSKLAESADSPATIFLRYSPVDDRYCLTVNLCPKSQTIEFIAGKDEDAVRKPAVLPQRFAFDLILWDEMLWIRIDENEPVIFRFTFPEWAEPGALLGLGSSWTNCGSVGFGDVEAQLLEEMPAELAR